MSLYPKKKSFFATQYVRTISIKKKEVALNIHIILPLFEQTRSTKTTEAQNFPSSNHHKWLPHHILGGYNTINI